MRENCYTTELTKVYKINVFILARDKIITTTLIRCMHDHLSYNIYHTPPHE